MAQRQMHLVAFLMTGPTCHHRGAWRHQETDIADILSRSRHEPIARVLEAAVPKVEERALAPAGLVYRFHRSG